MGRMSGKREEMMEKGLWMEDYGWKDDGWKNDGWRIMDGRMMDGG